MSRLGGNGTGPSGHHKRQRKFPGIKGRRPDLKEERRLVAAENTVARQAARKAIGR